ncbi:MAG TPA: hypothetical protein VKT81_09890 [Bryobacteraceae bacterium]|nr:hypothetical protein [Bryobacteraceae bacterium]
MHRTLAALLLFGISFGYLEAAVVVYLRAIYDPIRERIHPGRALQDLFPLISPDELKATGPENEQRLKIEIGREAATILMLAAFGMAAGKNFNQRMAAFAIAFGIWDISFYGFLRLMIGWPQSLFTWDILFLIPLPWVGPVLSPVIISAMLIGCGTTSLLRGGLPAKPWQWLAMLSGGLVVIVAFIWDFRNITTGGQPNPFNWPLFLAGGGIALAAFIAAARNPKCQESQIPRGS